MHDLQLTTYLTFLYTFAFSLYPPPTPWSYSVLESEELFVTLLL